MARPSREMSDAVTAPANGMRGRSTSPTFFSAVVLPFSSPAGAVDRGRSAGPDVLDDEVDLARPRIDHQRFGVVGAVRVGEGERVDAGQRVRAAAAGDVGFRDPVDHDGRAGLAVVTDVADVEVGRVRLRTGTHRHVFPVDRGCAVEVVDPLERALRRDREHACRVAGVVVQPQRPRVLGADDQPGGFLQVDALQAAGRRANDRAVARATFAGGGRRGLGLRRGLATRNGRARRSSRAPRSRAQPRRVAHQRETEAASSSRSSSGRTSWKSPTMPTSATSKTSACGSVLIASTERAARTPTMWLNFPLAPITT